MKKILTVLFLVLCCTKIAAAAEPELNYTSFGLLPVLHEGRIKPLDSFARIMLREFSGRDAVRGHGAAEWLAEVLFDPVNAAETPVFEITNPAVREHFSLRQKRTLFSFPNWHPASQHMPPKRKDCGAPIPIT